MKNLTIKLAPIFLFAMLSSPAAFAQAEQTPERIPGAEDLAAEEAEDAEDAGDAESADAASADVESSEVDFNEDNFRRSMELRDAALQRSPDLTTGSYSPETGVRALDELPEASQKHLREELREVIVENGPWTPEEAGETYPYVPSPDAIENGTLGKREQVAWTELVAKYHEREAAIHANAGRSQAATDSAMVEGAPAGDAGSQGSPADGQASETGSKTEAGQNPDKAERAAALAELLESGGEAGAESGAGAAPVKEQGVSQNALELLTERQQLPAVTAAPESERNGGGGAEPQIELDSEGVIAIEDLEKVRLDPEAAEKD